jgi:hypothetical protein
LEREEEVLATARGLDRTSGDRPEILREKRSVLCDDSRWL